TAGARPDCERVYRPPHPQAEGGVARTVCGEGGGPDGSGVAAAGRAGAGGGAVPCPSRGRRATLHPRRGGDRWATAGEPARGLGGRTARGGRGARRAGGVVWRVTRTCTPPRSPASPASWRRRGNYLGN